MADKMTLDDIAEALGLSKTTVSRAISGKGRVGAETREKVLAYIEKTNYKPNVQARGLATNRTYNIGVVCPTDYEIFDLPFFHCCLRGISETAVGKGYDVLICMVEKNNTSSLKRIVEDKKVDGILLMRTLVSDPLSDYLKTTDIPFAVIGSSPDKELVQIDNDHLDACSELTSIMMAKGCRKIALIGRDENQVITQTRRRGFEKAYERMGLEPDPSLIYLDAGDVRKTEVIVASAMDKGADALLCMDEKITGFVLTACRKLHVHIPADVKVASFYNSAFLDNAVPAITAIDINDRALGNVAAETLLSMIEGEVPGNRYLKNYQIILRESTT